MSTCEKVRQGSLLAPPNRIPVPSIARSRNRGIERRRKQQPSCDTLHGQTALLPPAPALLPPTKGVEHLYWVKLGPNATNDDRQAPLSAARAAAAAAGPSPLPPACTFARLSTLLAVLTPLCRLTMALLPLPGRVYSWAWLDDCGDAFEGVLAALAPGDVAACRLVSRAWRREVDLLLQQLAPAPGSEPAAVVATFPHLTSLRLTAGSTTASSGSSPTSSGSNPTSTGSSPTSSGGSGGSNASCVRLPPLGALVSLRRLRTLSLIGPAPAGGQLDCCSLLPLSGAPPALAALELSGLRLRHAAALQQLTQLTCLHLAGSGALSGWPRSLPALLAPLRRLSHLHFSCTALPSAAALGPADPVAAAAAAAEDAAVAAAVAAAGLVDSLAPPGAAGLLDGLSDLTTLVSLELCCHDGGSEAAVAEIAALPRLRRLSISRCASFGAGAPSVSDASLALLSRTLGHQLSSLTLTGHHGIGDDGLHAVARCGVLRHLDLRLGAPGIPT